MRRAYALEPREPTPQAERQDVHLDLGVERASVQWRISVPLPASSTAHEYTLWDAPLVELVHAQVDAHGAPEMLRVQSRGSSVVLCVPSIGRSYTASLTLYAKVALLPRPRPAVRAATHTDPMPCSPV